MMYLLGSITVLFLIDCLARLRRASLATLPLMIVATMVFRVRSERAYRRVRERIASVLSFMQETVRGVHVVQAFGRERFNRRRFRQVNEDWREANIESFRPSASSSRSSSSSAVVGTAVVLGYGGCRTIHGDISVGVLAAFVLYLLVDARPDHAAVAALRHLPAGDGRSREARGAARRSTRRSSTRRRVGASDGSTASAGFDDVTFRTATGCSGASPT